MQMLKSAAQKVDVSAFNPLKVYYKHTAKFGNIFSASFVCEIDLINTIYYTSEVLFKWLNTQIFL